jgi:hypothetical protein
MPLQSPLPALQFAIRSYQSINRVESSTLAEAEQREAASKAQDDKEKRKKERGDASRWFSSFRRRNFFLAPLLLSLFVEVFFFEAELAGS